MDDLKQRLRAATEGVTPGPWRVVERQAEDDPDETALDMLDGRGWRVMSHGDGYYASVPDRDDWPFIAAARQLVPEAAAALDAKDAEIEKLRQACKNHGISVE